ncbi:MAG: ATP-binding protein [Candidatus Cloacimonetes bacterium]|nr:ATP-binding protein [Candidatus Cloacimonadota bacterium]MCF7868101.1 ATP-binding protein [Candidatus Cloacimonadota bacterium]MCF7883567.1 ATP-binding protein [Candidatus Cloacimonadota bacterium]
MHKIGGVMIIRESAAILKRLATYFPVVSVTGPRQSGKSTLVRAAYKNYPYVSLEDPRNRKLATDDPYRFFQQYDNGVIIDEVQRVPDLFSYIQVIVDKKKMMGQFILTGSNQYEYMHNITQSLAGRMATIKLLPFSYKELYKQNSIKLEEVLFNGMYPAIFDRKIPPSEYYPSYVTSYVERDVRQIKNIASLTKFQNFLNLCAGRTGRILNKESLANECGISQPTVEEWLTILEASFILYRFRPYFKNMKKRIIRSPKLYFFDTGLVCYLLGIHSEKQLETHPLRGEIFETFVMSEFTKYHFHRAQRNNYYFFRDSNLNEIDLIIETGFGAVPVEIKSGQSLNDSFFKGLNFFRKLSDKHKCGGLIYAGNQEITFKNTIIKNYTHIYDMYEELIERENWKIEEGKE